LSRGNSLLKVDASNGNLLKEFKNENPVFYPFASKEVEVYSTLYSNICCYDFGGELRWKRKISVMATPVIADTMAVYGSSNYGEVSAYDIRTGKELWTAKVGDRGGLLFIGIYKELLIAVFEGGRTVAIKR
jgi:outer membrane protein assembly factor BamB